MWDTPLYLVPFRRSLLLNLGLGQWAASPRIPLFLPIALELQVQLCLDFSVGPGHSTSRPTLSEQVLYKANSPDLSCESSSGELKMTTY